MTGRLEGKVAWVTGAGSGLGAATAGRFAAEGARVVLTDIDRSAAEVQCMAIVDAGGEALAFEQDVTDETLWDTLMEQVLERWGALDVLVNNAGIVIPGSVEDATLDDWRATQAVNLDSVFLGTRAAVRRMQQRGGSIINISSIEGLVGEPGVAAYNASKGGVRIFTKSAALHCAQSGYAIRVNSVHPGFIRTPMVEKGFEALHADDAAAIQAQMAEGIPVGKMGEPLDIANGCLFLASDESRYMTGAELVIDGGFTAR